MILYLIIITIIIIAIILAIKANKATRKENKKLKKKHKKKELTTPQLNWKIAENNSVLSEYKICLATWVAILIIATMLISFLLSYFQVNVLQYQKHYKETLQVKTPVVVDNSKNYYISTNKDKVYYISETGLEQKNIMFCKIIESTETKIEVYDLKAKLPTEKLLWNMLFFANLNKEFYVIYTPDLYKYAKYTSFREVKSIAQKAMLATTT